MRIYGCRVHKKTATDPHTMCQQIMKDFRHTHHCPFHFNPSMWHPFGSSPFFIQPLTHESIFACMPEHLNPLALQPKNLCTHKSMHICMIMCMCMCTRKGMHVMYAPLCPALHTVPLCLTNLIGT